MPNTEFKDLGYKFKIDAVDSIPTELRNEFKDELSETDKDLIEYFFNLKLNAIDILSSSVLLTLTI